MNYLPDDHPHLAASYNNVGLTYGYLGDYSKALEFKLKALSVCEKIFPNEHPNIADTCSNIAFTLGQANRFRDAMPYIQRAVTIGELSLLPEHPSLSNYRQGKKMLERCAQLQEKGIAFPNPFL